MACFLPPWYSLSWTNVWQWPLVDYLVDVRICSNSTRTASGGNGPGVAQSWIRYTRPTRRLGMHLVLVDGPSIDGRVSPSIRLPPIGSDFLGLRFRSWFDRKARPDSSRFPLGISWRPFGSWPTRSAESGRELERCGGPSMDEGRSDEEEGDWDHAGSEEGTSDLQREWKTRRDRFYVHGFREGLDEGKEETLQQGFNEGFSAGSRAGFHLGFSQGVYEALVKLDEAGLHKLTEKEKGFIEAIDSLPASRVSHKEVLATGDVEDIDAELQALGLDPNVIGAEGQSHGTGPSE